MEDDPTLPAPGCVDFEPLLAARLLAPLGHDDERALFAHLEQCAGCLAVAADLEKHPVGAALLDEGVIAADDFAELRVVAPDNYVRGEEIGRGGMGRVVRARDRRLGRHVVIKELLDGRLRDRFEQEARLTARLQHPAIVNVHEAGRWPSGDSFYAMKHVAGQPLDKVIAARPALAGRLALLPNLITVVEAIAYAHSQRVIHRDLKPANIVVGPWGETVVIDWGLAKDLAAGGADAAEPYRGDGVSFTVAGAGTPSYMPPEQADGRAADERVDVYALGATLWHLLAGKAPGKTPLPAGTPPALAAIVKKAMARDPGDRYPTAGALSEELKRFTGGQLVAAHSYSLRERLERFIRRNRTLVAAAAVSLAVLGVVAGVSLGQVLRARRDAEGQLAELLLERGRDELTRGSPARALVYLAEAQRHGLDTPALRALLGEAVRPFDDEVERFQLPVRASGAAFSSDGTRLVTADGAGKLLLWDLATRKPVTLAEDARGPIRMAFAPDGKSLFAVVDDTVRIWEAAGGKLRGSIKHPLAISSARWEGDAVLLTVTSLDAATWDLDGRALASQSISPRAWPVASGRGDTIASLERPGDPRPPAEPPYVLGGAEASRWRRVFLPGTGVAPLQLAAVMPDLAELTVGLGSSVAELRRADGTATTLRHGAPITAARFGDGGRIAVTAGRDGTLRVWDVAAGVELAVYDVLGQVVEVGVGASAGEGPQLLALGDDGEVRRWIIDRAALRPDQARWDLSAGERVRGRVEVPVLDGMPASLAGGEGLTSAPGGRLVAGLAGGEAAQRVFVWDAQSGRLLHQIPVVHRATLVGQKIAVSPAGDLVATIVADRRVALWTAGGQQRAVLVAAGAVEHIVFSPRGDRVLTAGSGAGAALWDTGGRMLLDLPALAATAVAFDPAGARVLIGERDGHVRAWDVETGMLLASLGPLPEPITDLAFDAGGDGAFLVHGDRTAEVSLAVSTRSPAETAALAARVPLRLEGGKLVSIAPRRDTGPGPAPIPPVPSPAALTEQMKLRFEDAQDAYGRRRFDEAAAGFLAAYELKPAPSLLYNAGVCYEKLGRYRQAATLFQSYLEQADGRGDRAAVELRITGLLAAAEAHPAGAP